MRPFSNHGPVKFDEIANTTIQQLLSHINHLTNKAQGSAQFFEHRRVPSLFKLSQNQNHRFGFWFVFKMKLNDFEPLFGESKVEWLGSGSGSDSDSVRPFVFQVHAPDPGQLRVHVTDFFATSFQAVRSIEQLHDMRDDIGIGGSWSEFLEYFVHSIKFGEVKLLLEGKSKSHEAESARLIAQKSKGMPRISVSLHRLPGTAANEAMASFSLVMYRTYKSNQKWLIEEQEGRNQLTKRLSAEREKSEYLQKQLDELLYSNRHKSQKIHDKLTSADTSSATTLHDISDKQSDHNPSPMKASKRAVPAHRRSNCRSKVRGVLLQDTEDD